jgi:hypothetical protein
LAAQSLIEQQEAAKAKAVTPRQQQTEETIEDAREKEAEHLRQLQLVMPAMTSEEKLKAMLDDALVGNGLKSLQKARIDVATTELNARWKEYCNGRGTLDIVIASSRRLLEAETDLSIKKADQAVAWESHLQRMKDLHAINLARFNAGRVSIMDVKEVEFYRLQAEIWLERAKAELKKSRQSS